MLSPQKEKYDQTVHFLRERCPTVSPVLGIVLGSGLGEFILPTETAHSVPYEEVPHFARSTALGHAGKWLVGQIEGIPFCAMQGRFHYYEGYSMEQVTFPIRVMSCLGVKTLIVSNAAGGLDPTFQEGDIMLISDHINHFPDHPLRGKNEDRFGVRFPDMSQVYDPDLRSLAHQVATKWTIPLHEGIYIGSSGPTYETPAEYRLFRQWGAQATGMSTVPEVIVARHCGMRVLGFSVITNVFRDDPDMNNTHQEVMDNALKAMSNLSRLVRKMVAADSLLREG